MNYTFKYIIFFFCCIQISYLHAEKLPEHIKQAEDSLIRELKIAKSDSLRVERYYDLSNIVYEYNYVKGLKYIDQSIHLAEEIGEVRGITWGYYLKGIIFYYMSDFDRSIEELFKALESSRELDSDKLLSRINSYIGINYYELNDFNKSLIYAEKALEIWTTINYLDGLADSYNNIGLILFEQGKLDDALKYYEKSLEYSTNDIYDIAVVYINIVQIYLKREQFPEAYKKLNYLLSIEDQINNFLVLAEFYYIFGFYYIEIEDYDNAIFFFNKSIELSKEKRFWKFMRLSSDKMSQIYSKLLQYEKVYENLDLYYQANDSLNDNMKKEKVIKLEMKHEYDQYLANISLKSQKRKFRFYLYTTALLMFIILFGFLYYRQKNKIKQNKRKYENQNKLFDTEMNNSSLEKKKLQEELEFRSSELKYKNNELINFALEIVQKNDFIKQIGNKLKKITLKLKKAENLRMANEIETFVHQSLNLDKDRKDFHKNIEVLHKDFLSKLITQFPDLSEYEKKLALLSRLKYSSKKISIILDINSSSVDKARSRLRKRLNIESETSLYDFLNSL